MLLLCVAGLSATVVPVSLLCAGIDGRLLLLLHGAMVVVLWLMRVWLLLQAESRLAVHGGLMQVGQLLLLRVPVRLLLLIAVATLQWAGLSRMPGRSAQAAAARPATRLVAVRGCIGLTRRPGPLVPCVQDRSQSGWQRTALQRPGACCALCLRHHRSSPGPAAPVRGHRHRHHSVPGSHLRAGR